ncbi:MAG: NAD-binding protein [bacterium]|nr:NAD-binding protein [bacterium]
MDLRRWLLRYPYPPRHHEISDARLILRAHLFDLWLFLRRISLNLVSILIVLLFSAVVLDTAQAWPDTSFMTCFTRAFYMMTLEGVDPPRFEWLEIFVFLLPLAGLMLAGEGLVSAFTLFMHRSLRQGEWNMIVASTYTNHIIICGMGQLGCTLCLELTKLGEMVVGIDLDEDQPGVVTARRGRIPVVIGDMTLQETLTEANVQKARCVVVCSGDDLANIETSIEAKEINPGATVYSRVFKKSLADKINSALKFDIISFSPYATAAEAILSRLKSPS